MLSGLPPIIAQQLPLVAPLVSFILFLLWTIQRQDEKHLTKIEELYQKNEKNLKEQIESLEGERNGWREISLRSINVGQQATSIVEQTVRPRRTTTTSGTLRAVGGQQ